MIQAAISAGELPGLWSLSPIGFGLGVIAVVYWLLITGRLVPRASHVREMATEAKRGDEWKETAHSYRDANVLLLEQNGGLIKANTVVEAFLRAADKQGDTEQFGGT